MPDRMTDDPQQVESDDHPVCPVCGFPMTEQRSCTPFCRNCGYKGVCGDPFT
jgi:predicted amidophosphoribosyltransferase